VFREFGDVLPPKITKHAPSMRTSMDVSIQFCPSEGYPSDICMVVKNYISA